jgi:hypothetical protein
MVAAGDLDQDTAVSVLTEAGESTKLGPDEVVATIDCAMKGTLLTSKGSRRKAEQIVDRQLGSAYDEAGRLVVIASGRNPVEVAGQIATHILKAYDPLTPRHEPERESRASP